MRNNEITYLPGSLVTLKGLQELDMSDNPLKDVMNDPFRLWHRWLC